MRWTEGVCGDGAVILFDGQPVSISDLLTILNRAYQIENVVRDAIKLIEGGLPAEAAGELDRALNVGEEG